ncbi:MFS transporter [Adlercreutzia equolifaciens]|uniref:MFS transporter n=1 Tax=Adlercreutzia equolifaciens TaxID=446660 RepID=UPI001EE0130E|nr:MFS transporter [Adlercreutzia equolifaciens]MCG4825206.1 MFS transporter [Adlercreutzia equolifaciens]
MDDALEAPPDPHRWIILALVCALALAGNYLQYQITALGVVLMVRLHLDITSFSFLFLAPMVVAVVLGIPLGCAGDRFGPKRVVATGFFVSFVGAVIRLLWLDSFAMQYVGMLLIGVGMCALASNYLKVLGCWFGLDTDRAVGIYYASSCLGIVIAQSSTAFLASIEQAYGIGAALLGVLLLLWCAFGSSEPSVSHERKSVLEATGE